MTYKQGQTVQVFKNYEENKGYLGNAELLSFIHKGMPFILENMPQFTFNYEYWRVKFLDNGHIENRPIRYIECEGTNCEEQQEIKEEQEEEERRLNQLQKDSFKIIPEWGDCF